MKVVESSFWHIDAVNRGIHLITHDDRHCKACRLVRSDIVDSIREGDTPANRIDIDADARSVAVVGNWAVIDQLDLYAKLGIYNIDVKSRSRVGDNVINIDSDENEVFGAFGVEYDLGILNLFSEFSIADTGINDLTIDVATAGVKFEF